MEISKTFNITVDIVRLYLWHCANIDVYFGKWRDEPVNDTIGRTSTGGNR